MKENRIQSRTFEHNGASAHPKSGGAAGCDLSAVKEMQVLALRLSSPPPDCSDRPPKFLPRQPRAVGHTAFCPVGRTVFFCDQASKLLEVQAVIYNFCPSPGHSEGKGFCMGRIRTQLSFTPPRLHSVLSPWSRRSEGKKARG